MAGSYIEEVEKKIDERILDDGCPIERASSSGKADGQPIIPYLRSMVLAVWLAFIATWQMSAVRDKISTSLSILASLPASLKSDLYLLRLQLRERIRAVNKYQ